MAEKSWEERRAEKTETICCEIQAVRTDGKWFRANDMYFQTPPGCEVGKGDKVVLEATTQYALKSIIGSYEKWCLEEEQDG